MNRTDRCDDAPNMPASTRPRSARIGPGSGDRGPLSDLRERLAAGEPIDADEVDRVAVRRPGRSLASRRADSRRGLSGAAPDPPRRRRGGVRADLRRVPDPRVAGRGAQARGVLLAVPRLRRPAPAPARACTTPSARPRPGPRSAPGGEPAAADGPRAWRSRWCPGFEVLGILGQGGMSVVYLARQAALNRLVALKVIRARVYADPDIAARFRDEAEAAARFQHPNIVQVYEVGESEGQGYLVLEYAAGGSLQQKLAGNPQPPREAARLIETLARALHYAHQHGIVHRDLKPANVVLTEEGTPKVTDFGLAKLMEREAGLTRTGDIMGTPSYMAPEQATRHARGRHGRRRHLCPGCDPLRDAHRPAAVQGRDAAVDPRPGRRPGGPAAGTAPAPPAARDRDHLPEVPGEGAAQAVRDGRGPGRRPAPVPRGSADRGPADRPGGVALALVPSRAGQGRAGRGPGRSP